MQLIQYLFIFIASLLGVSPALADATLPSIDERYVSIQEVNPTRDAGFVVGDTLDRTITLNIKKPYELVKESLPIVGYEHRWKGQISGIELVKISTEEHKNIDSVTHVIHLTYQVFTTSRTAKPAALRGEIIKIRNTTKKELVQYRIPSFNFRVSPLSVYGQVVLKNEMSPFHSPLLLDPSKEENYMKLLAGLLGLSLLGLLYILGMRAWLPKMGAPFARAYRDIRKMTDDVAGIQQAVARMHQSLNITAGSIMFNDNIDDFIQAKPAFSPMKKELEKFFDLSRRMFFEPQTTLEENEKPKTWLLSLCRHLRDCERGLKPNVGA